VPANTLYNGSSDVLESIIELYMDGYVVTLSFTFYEIAGITDTVKFMSLIGTKKMKGTGGCAWTLHSGAMVLTGFFMGHCRYW
jgi:hypothetical protein